MLTVFIATRNRATILRQTLESFCALEPPSGGWKIVVADNGSTDQTLEMLASFTGRLPLESLYEPNGGKNSALNAALGSLEGDLAVFTDDDTFPHRNWLVELRKSADAQPAYSIFSGAVVPRWESPPPNWTQWIDQGPIYSITDPLLKDGPIPPFLVFGPNMAVRSAIFDSGMHFESSIGPRGSSYAMGSETQLTGRLYKQGHKAWHVHSAVVEHFIRDDQMRQSWVLKRAINYGRGRYRLRHLEVRPEGVILWCDGPQWFGIPRRFFRDIFRAQARIIVASLTSNERQLIAARWKRNFRWGSVMEAWESNRAKKRVPAKEKQ